MLDGLSISCVARTRSIRSRSHQVRFSAYRLKSLNSNFRLARVYVLKHYRRSFFSSYQFRSIKGNFNLLSFLSLSLSPSLLLLLLHFCLRSHPLSMSFIRFLSCLSVISSSHTLFFHVYVFFCIILSYFATFIYPFLFLLSSFFPQRMPTP